MSISVSREVKPLQCRTKGILACSKTRTVITGVAGGTAMSIADQEIDVLAVDLVPKALVLVGSGHEENVSQIHLETDDGSITDGSAENSVERQFRRREKIIPLAVG